MKKFFLFYLTIIIFGVSIIPCSGSFAKEPEKAPTEIRISQTRLYDTNDTQKVMKAIINNLQDEGYVLSDMSYELGVITAKKEAMIKPAGSALNKLLKCFLLGAFGGIAGAAATGAALGSGNSIEQAMEITTATANITNLNNQIKIRVNFSRKTKIGQTETSAEQINDPIFYQDFFSKLDKSLFLESQEI